MKRSMLMLLLVFISGSVQAQSVMFGKRLISRGDDAAHVRDVAGAPDKVDLVAADQYSPAMEIWTYHRKGMLVSLWIVGAKVVQAQELADQNSGASTAAAAGASGR